MSLGEVLDLVEVFSVRHVLVLADLPLLEAAPEHHRAAGLFARRLQGALDGLAIALLLRKRYYPIFGGHRWCERGDEGTMISCMAVTSLRCISAQWGREGCEGNIMVPWN